MPRFTEDMEQNALPSSQYGYSATRLDKLVGSSDYSLVTIAVDVSQSTESFAYDMEQAIKAILEACKASPRAASLQVRLVTFNARLTEIHGFKLLSEINPEDYNNTLRPAGMTACFDAVYNSAEASMQEAKRLVENYYSANGVLFVITDGCDNESSVTAQSVAQMFSKVRQAEVLDSFVTVLIGVNVQSAEVKTYLEDFNTNAKFTRYVELPDARPGTLAKLAEFASKSVSLVSNSLQNGNAAGATQAVASMSF